MTLFDRVALVVDTTEGAYFKYMNNKSLFIEVSTDAVGKDLMNQLKVESIKSYLVQGKAIYVEVRNGF